MQDKISRYRQIRLTIQVSPTPKSPTNWTLSRIGVRKGQPITSVIATGQLPPSDMAPSDMEAFLLVARIAEALRAS